MARHNRPNSPSRNRQGAGLVAWRLQHYAARTDGLVEMKIAIMGAGAVGCYYGFKLARAGHDVMLIGRPQHVEAIGRQGLRLETQTSDERIRVSASTEGSAARGAQ